MHDITIEHEIIEDLKEEIRKIKLKVFRPNKDRLRLRQLEARLKCLREQNAKYTKQLNIF